MYEVLLFCVCWSCWSLLIIIIFFLTVCPADSTMRCCAPLDIDCVSSRSTSIPQGAFFILKLGSCFAYHTRQLTGIQLYLSYFLASPQAMKDYFLLARGEFFQVLIEEGMAFMSLPPTSRAEKGVCNRFCIRICVPSAIMRMFSHVLWE